jgi:hypothetical protein
MNDDPSSLLHKDRLGWRIPEWCRITGVKRGAVYSQIARGQLETVRVGSTTLIPRRVAVEAGLLDA